MLVTSAVFHPLLMATYSCIILYLILPVVFSPIPINAIPTVAEVVQLLPVATEIMAQIIIQAARKIVGFRI